MENINPIIQDLLQLDEADTCDNDESAPEQEAELLENKIEEENIQPALKLDYKLATCAERATLVNEIIAQTPQENLTHRYLEILGDYIMGGITKEEKKNKMYLTDNRLITINKRETSYENLAEKFENGEDGIYNLIINDKNTLLSPKISITQEDIETIPGLKELRDEIDKIEIECKNALGKRKYLLKKQLIEMRKDQYLFKNFYKMAVTIPSTPKGTNKIDLSASYYLDKDGEPQSTGLISFFNEKHICAILCNYNALKIETHAKYFSDFYYLMQDFDKLLNRALQEEELLYDIVKQKLNNKTNLEIKEYLFQKYNHTYTPEYLSVLWRNKIPKIIATQAKKDYIIQHFLNHPELKWKKCSCCKARKPAHPYFFSKNSTSKDGWYSLCKNCRNTRAKK